MIDQFKNIPKGYQYMEEVFCPKCDKDTVYGLIDSSEDVWEGDFICQGCNYKFNKPIYYEKIIVK